MSGKLNHLAITTDHYAVIGMFYRAVFGMKVSGDTSREMSAISVGDGYVGMTIIPRRGGRKAGLDHFGIEVEDLDKVREKMAKKYPDIEIVKRPGNRPFASYSRPRSGWQLFRPLPAGPREPRRGLRRRRVEAGQHHQPLCVARAPRRQDGGVLFRYVRSGGAQHVRASPTAIISPTAA